MKRKRFNEEQIIGILKESEAGGKNQQICRKHGISEQTFYRWRSKYGRLQVSEARRLQQLEAEVHLDRAAQTHPQDPPHAGAATTTSCGRGPLAGLAEASVFIK